MFRDGDGKRGRGKPAPYLHETQQGADTPGQRASAAVGNVVDPHRAPVGHRGAGPSSTRLTVRQRILALFVDDTVMRLAQVATALPDLAYDTIGTTIKRMVEYGDLYRIRHGQYSKRKDATPIEPTRIPWMTTLCRRMAAIEERLAELEKRGG